MASTILMGLLGATSGLLAHRRVRHCLPGVRSPHPGTVWALVMIGLTVGVAGALTHTEPAARLTLAHLLLIALPLAAYDARTATLPRQHVLATYPSSAVVVALASWWSGGTATLLHAAIGAATLWLLLLALAFAGGIGAGDVRLAPVLGSHLGLAGLPAVLTGTIASFVIGALAAITLSALGRLGPDRRIPFGPPLLAGTIAALIL